jgi:hypothetical protein
VVAAGRPELARLVPDLGPTEATEPRWGELARARWFELLLGMVERLAAERSLVLAVKDLHWADRSTPDLLSFLMPRLGEAAVVRAASYRSDELGRRHPLRRWLAELGRHVSVERLELDRLDRAELGDLLAGILGAAPAAGLVEEVLTRSQGNPFITEELLAFGPAGSPGALPVTVHDLLAARVDVLSGPGRHVLRVAVVAGVVGHQRTPVLRADRRILAQQPHSPVVDLLGSQADSERDPAAAGPRGARRRCPAQRRPARSGSCSGRVAAAGLAGSRGSRAAPGSRTGVEPLDTVLQRGQARVGMGAGCYR